MGAQAPLRPRSASASRASKHRGASEAHARSHGRSQCETNAAVRRRAGRTPRTRIKIEAATALSCIAIGAPPAHAAGPGCGAVVTKSTTLQRNLTNCPGDGFVIGADNLTLDLGRHTIDGTAPPATAGTGSPAITASRSRAARCGSSTSA